MSIDSRRVRLQRVDYSSEKHGCVVHVAPTKRRAEGSVWRIPGVYAGGKDAVVKFSALRFGFGRLVGIMGDPRGIARRAKRWTDDGFQPAQIGRACVNRRLLQVVLDQYPEARFANCKVIPGCLGRALAHVVTAWDGEALCAVIAPLWMGR